MQTMILVFALAVAGCGGAAPVSAEMPQGIGTAGEVVLRFDAPVQYRDLELRWLKLEDSRCAIGLACVWAGQMLAVLAVSRDGGAAVELNLRTQVGREPEISTAFGYEFSLVDVEPHPKNNVTISRSEQRLRLLVSSL